MGNLIQIFCTLLIQLEVGLTPKNRPARKTVRIPFIRPDATDAEIVAFIGVLQPCLVGKILSVKLETKKITAVLTPEMREEKKQREDEEEIMNSHKEQTRQASASCISQPLRNSLNFDSVKEGAASNVAQASWIPEERPILFSVPSIRDALFRLNPRPKTTTQIGIAEPLRKVDAPVYSDTPHFQ